MLEWKGLGFGFSVDELRDELALGFGFLNCQFLQLTLSFPPLLCFTRLNGEDRDQSFRAFFSSVLFFKNKLGLLALFPL